MKNIFYVLCILAIPGIAALLMYQRQPKETVQKTEQNAQTIIPAAIQLQPEPDKSNSSYKDENSQSSIPLSSDEIVIEAINADINGDGKEDTLIAAKKISDPFLYIIICLQDTKTQSFIRTAEIKTKVTQTHTLSFHTIGVQEYAYPLIVYNGMNAENMQLFSLLTCSFDSDHLLHTSILIELEADGQILFQKNEQQQTLAAYNIYTYHSDPAFPQTLNQIKQVYEWDASGKTFTQKEEVRIPGKKIETQLLKKLQNTDTKAFKMFLQGLWYQPSSTEGHNRSIFINSTDNEIIFTVNNIEEVFKITGMVPKRYGMHLSTKNTSISSINRHINIELAGVDEIYVQVIEDIARLKIGTSSNWDGAYRKIQNSIQTNGQETALSAMKTLLISEGKQWTSNDGTIIMFSDSSYTVTHNKTEDEENEIGIYTLLFIKDKTILQMKNDTGKNRFFILTADTSEKQTMTLTEVAVSLNEISLIGTPPKSFE